MKEIKEEIVMRTASKIMGQRIYDYPIAFSFLLFRTREERGKLYQEAFEEYLEEHLPMSEAVLVEPTAYNYMKLISGRFPCEQEENSFYDECASFFLHAYGDLIGLSILDPTGMERKTVPEGTPGEFPKIEGKVFTTIDSYSNKQNALWLCKAHQQKLEELQASQDKGAQKVKVQVGQ